MKYPVFRKKIDDTLVVCFISEFVGTVVVENDDYYKIGHYGTTWDSAEDTSIWTDWNQEVKDLSCVVIENEKDLDEFRKMAGNNSVIFCTFPIIVQKEKDKFRFEQEDNHFHRTQFKDYVVWSEDKEKAKEILGFKIKFELKYDNPVYIADNNVFKTWSKRVEKYGKIRTNKKQAELALKSQIRQMRLGALIDQCGGQKEWVEDRYNWYLLKIDKRWMIDFTYRFFNPEKIYCDKKTAIKARDILNRGEYSLEVER